MVCGNLWSSLNQILQTFSIRPQLKSMAILMSLVNHIQFLSMNWPIFFDTEFKRCSIRAHHFHIQTWTYNCVQMSWDRRKSFLAKTHHHIFVHINILSLLTFKKVTVLRYFTVETGSSSIALAINRSVLIENNIHFLWEINSRKYQRNITLNLLKVFYPLNDKRI